MSSKKRRYELKARAERQRQTRERIVTATVALHQEVGPARTTVAEVARRAGVTRLTVYNNFPTDEALLGACQGHYFAAHPQPDVGPAFALDDPAKRLHEILRRLYPWYRENEPMLANSLRDRSLVPALDGLLAETVDVQFAELAGALAAGWAPASHEERLRALIGVALSIWTWRHLAEQGLDDGAAAHLMADAVECVASANAAG
jgi:AcrR family transcriptional regulator